MQRGLVGSEMCIRDRVMKKDLAQSRPIINPLFGYSENSNFLNSFKTLPNKGKKVFGGQIKELIQGPSRGDFQEAYLEKQNYLKAVSYTHLTLPTILLVQISVVAVSLKKKKIKHTKRAETAKRHAKLIVDTNIDNRMLAKG
eukprot:TRINITY_DN8489_c0_g1_i7.p1 TRINITY_DN8489_c0_g1~~TRINITY_DN8489_c0_g1_i7.p1  ORF type:complete len:142 (-),score=38.30 TRINITY_DN8489_c0_g1_i7:25-450(-)